MTALSQIRLTILSHDLIRVIVKQNNFVAGEIDLTYRIFYSVPRSTRNLFYLYHGDEGGIGINEEILHLESFDFIKIKFSDQILTTTRHKWLKKGVPSRYSGLQIDRQIILKLSEISLIDMDKYEPARVRQQELFREVI